MISIYREGNMETRMPELSGYSIVAGVVRNSDLRYVIAADDNALREVYTGSSILYCLHQRTWYADAVPFFNGQLYVSSNSFVYRLEDGKLNPVDFGDEFVQACYLLSAADGIMWSIGNKDVMEFDGSSWKRVLRID